MLFAALTGHQVHYLVILRFLPFMVPNGGFHIEKQRPASVASQARLQEFP